MRDLLLEIGTEEIPARFIPQTLSSMRDLMGRYFEDYRIPHGPIIPLGTPRRLVLKVEGVAERQQEAVSKVIGPPVKVAFDEGGRPTKAALSFAERQGVAVEELGREDTERGMYLCVVKERAGEEAASLLAELLPKLILAIPFPRGMRWGTLEIRFVRPIHWIVALFGSQVIPFSLDGIASGNVTYGHRFMSPGPVAVRDVEQYMRAMADGHVLLDPGQRLQAVRHVVAEAARREAGEAVMDEALLDEVTNMVEYAVAGCGRFSSQYLTLPRDVLISAMGKHQRYFPVEDGAGKLMPRFVFVSNTRVSDEGVVREGNERVLSARLADAKFFFDEDTKRPLADYVEELAGRVFQAELGNVYDKAQRVQEIAGYLAERLSPRVEEMVRRAAWLCKADLETEMVGEFPDLQGIMGREYALASGEGEAVAQAIYEHYLPRYAGDNLPRSDAGAIVAVADRVDSIVGCFAVGLIPSGSEDPYGLRRQALGTVAILRDRGYRFSLTALVNQAAAVLEHSMSVDTNSVRSDVISFVNQRMAYLFLTEGYAQDLVNSVIAAGCDDVVQVEKRLQALDEFRRRPDFDKLTVTFKRVSNILPDEEVGQVREDLFCEPAEDELARSVSEVKGRIQEALRRERYGDALQAIATLRRPVDQFFDSVLVMEKDQALRRNRLALLAAVAAFFKPVADFKKIGADLQASV